MSIEIRLPIAFEGFSKRLPSAIPYAIAVGIRLVVCEAVLMEFPAGEFSCRIEDDGVPQVRVCFDVLSRRLYIDRCGQRMLDSLGVACFMEYHLKARFSLEAGIRRLNNRVCCSALGTICRVSTIRTGFKRGIDNNGSHRPIHTI